MISLDPDLKQKLLCCEDLPSLPQLALELLNELEKTEPDEAYLVELFKSDLAIATRVLKVANSPLYGFVRQIPTIEEAVRLLGLKKCTLISLSFYVIQATKKPYPTGFDFTHFFQRGLFSATAAMVLGKDLALDVDLDSLFLCGLIQDIGVLVLACVDQASYTQAVQPIYPDHAALAAIENKLYGCDHAKIGSWLIEQWHFPTQLVSAISKSHQYQAGSSPLSNTVAASGFIADTFIAPSFQKLEVLTNAQAMLHRLLNLSPTQIDQQMVHINEAIKEVSEWFNQPDLIDIGDETLKVIEERQSELINKLDDE